MSLWPARHHPPRVSQRLCRQRVHLCRLLRDPKTKILSRVYYNYQPLS